MLQANDRSVIWSMTIQLPGSHPSALWVPTHSQQVATLGESYSLQRCSQCILQPQLTEWVSKKGINLCTFLSWISSQIIYLWYFINVPTTIFIGCVVDFFQDFHYISLLKFGQIVVSFQVTFPYVWNVNTICHVFYQKIFSKKILMT